MDEVAINEQGIRVTFGAFNDVSIPNFIEERCGLVVHVNQIKNSNKSGLSFKYSN